MSRVVIVPMSVFAIANLDVGMIAAGNCVGQWGCLQRGSLPLPPLDGHATSSQILDKALSGSGVVIHGRLSLLRPLPLKRNSAVSVSLGGCNPQVGNHWFRKREKALILAAILRLFT